MAAANEILVEKLGCKLDLQVLDGSAYAEKIKLAMSSGDNFDLCWLDDAIYTDAIQKGGLLSMNEYLEGSVLNDVVPENIMDFGRYEGNVYAIPNIQIMAIPAAVWVREDLANEYGLKKEDVTAIEDIEPFLEWVKNNKTEYYPLRLTVGSQEMMRDYQDIAYDSFVSDIISAYEDENGEIQVVKTVDRKGYWELAELRHDWYKKGYIRKDIATITDDWDDVNMGKYAVYTNGYKPGGIEGHNSRVNGFQYVEMVVAKPYMSYAAGTGTMTGIGRNSKNPELAFKLLELMNTDKELYNLITFGVEGKNYTKNADGKIKIIPEGGYAANAGWKFGNQYNAYVLESQPDDVWEKTKEINETARASKLIGFKPDVSDIKLEISQISTVNGKYSSIKKGYDAVENYKEQYMKDLEDAGIDRVLEVVEQQIEEWLAK